MRFFLFVFMSSLIAPAVAAGQSYVSEDGKVKIALVKMPYTGARNVPELSRVPDYLAEGGIETRLVEAGATLKPMATVELTREEHVHSYSFL